MALTPNSGGSSPVLIFDHINGTAYAQRPQQSAIPAALCPDRLRYEQIGEADNLRGRVVRGFFWLMRVWPPK